MKCPDCDEEMRWVGVIETGLGIYDLEHVLFQCPKCKRVELKTND